MLVEIPIVDKANETVALFVWDGTLYKGRSWFEQVAATPDQARAAEGIIAINRHLRGVRFLSIGDRGYVGGWFGLEGTVGALRIALPAVGLALGRFDPTDATVQFVDNTQQGEENNPNVIE